MLILKTVPGYPCTRTGKFGMFDKSCTRASLTLPKFAGPQRLTLGPRASMPLPGGLAQDGLPLHSACLDEHEVPKIAMAISGRARTTARKEPARTAPLPPMSPLAARPRRRRRTDLRVRLAPRSSRRGAAAAPWFTNDAIAQRVHKPRGSGGAVHLRCARSERLHGKRRSAGRDQQRAAR